MSTAKPLVSIGMPVYNGERYIRQALDSLLKQDYERFELIISDNASTDKTQSICLEYAAGDARIRFYRNQENMGVWWNFKRVLELAQGEYFMWAAHDDIRHKYALSSMMIHCMEDPEIVYVGSDYDVVNFVTGSVEHHDAPDCTLTRSCYDNCYMLLEQPTSSLVYGLFKTQSLRKTRFLTMDCFDFSDVYVLYEMAITGKMDIVHAVLYYAGVTERSRSPKTFARVRIRGFKFAYFRYYSASLALFITSGQFDWREKLSLAYLLSHQVMQLILWHEQEAIGKRTTQVLRFGMRCVDRALRRARGLLWIGRSKRSAQAESSAEVVAHAFDFLPPGSPRVYQMCRSYADRYDGNNNDNIYTNGELRLMHRMLGECTTVFDVGANVGTYATLALEINSSIDLHCFEPNPGTFQRLVEKRFPPNVTCNNFGLGSREEERPLYVFEDASPLNSFYRREGLEQGYGLRSPDRVEVVRVLTIDGYCQQKGIGRIDFLKLDVEGHELEVLKGARRMLASGLIQVVQFEYGGANIDSRTFLKDFYDLFESYNYTLLKVFPEGIAPIPRYDQRCDTFCYQNWVAMRADVVAHFNKCLR